MIVPPLKARCEAIVRVRDRLPDLNLIMSKRGGNTAATAFAVEYSLARPDLN